MRRVLKYVFFVSYLIIIYFKKEKIYVQSSRDRSREHMYVLIKYVRLKQALLILLIGVSITCITGLIPSPFAVGLDRNMLYSAEQLGGRTTGLPMIYVYDISQIQIYYPINFLKFDFFGFITDVLFWSFIVFILWFIYRKSRKKK